MENNFFTHLHNPPVVVLRSNDICFLGILRSAFTANIPTIPVVFDWDGAGPWFSEYSICFQDPVTIPNPYLYEEQAIEALVDLGKLLVAEWQQRILIIPSSDTNLMLIQNHYEELAPYFVQMGGPTLGTSRLDVIDKSMCANTLNHAGVKIPNTFSCEKNADIHPIADSITYPCIYKPSVKDYGQSFYRDHNHLKAVECCKRDELIDKLYHELTKDYKLIVQEKIELNHYTEEVPFYLYADAKQNVRMAATGIKTSVFPEPYGTATTLELSWQKELLPIAENIVRTLNWRGLLMIEFIKDNRDGDWKVLEINCRPWMFVDFYRRWGFNFIEYLYADYLNKLEEYPLFKSPSDILVRVNPIHVNILDEYKKRTQYCEDYYDHSIIDWLEGLGGVQSYPYYDPIDPEPGREQLNLMSHLYPINAMEIERFITGQIVDHV